MLTRHIHDRIDVHVESRSTMDEELNTAVDEMMQAALCSRTDGILVSRMTDTHFTIAISEHVPFGHTDQQDCRASVTRSRHLEGSEIAAARV